jgi:hypothetical protein
MDIDELLNEVPTQLEDNDLKEQLSVLISSGRCKEMVGKELTHEEVKKLPETEVKKYYKRYEAALASKTTDAVAMSAVGLAAKLLGYALPIDNVDNLQRDLRNDYLIAQELRITCGWLSLKCGKLMAVASGALHVVKHIDLEKLAKSGLSSWGDFKKDRLGLNQEEDKLLDKLDQVNTST